MLSWAAERIGVLCFRSDAQCLGYLNNDTLCAVVVYDTFSACDCCMHIASDGSSRWLTRELLIAAFSLAFKTFRLRRVTGLVPKKNTQALSFDKKLGFNFEGCCREAMIDDDLIILGMLRRNCRFIPPSWRQ